MAEETFVDERIEASLAARSQGRRDRRTRGRGDSPSSGGKSAVGPMFDTVLRGGWLFARRRARFRRLSPAGGFAVPGVKVTEIPAGLWVRSDRNRGSDREPLVPVGARWPAIVVGAPGEPRPQVHECARIVESLSGAARTQFTVMIYGWEAASVEPFAQRLADRLGEPVRGYHGMPFRTASGGTAESVIDTGGMLTWQPFVTVSVHEPGRPPLPVEWRCPADGLVPEEAGTYRLTDGWSVDLLPSGLLVRPSSVVADRELVLIPPHPAHVNLVVAAEFPLAVRSAVERMASALPAAARSRLRLVTAPGIDHTHLEGPARSLHVQVHGLSRSGPKSPLLVRRFVESVHRRGEPRTAWSCASCDTNNLAESLLCRRCRRGPAGAASRTS